MKKRIKMVLSIFIILMMVILVDTIQVKVLDNSNPSQKDSEREEHSFFGKVIESAQSYIIVEPNEEEEIRKSSDKISVSLGDTDAIYEVGTNVKITYEGSVMETYPAKVKATKIEVKSVDSFCLVFYQKTAIKPKQTETIINKDEVKGIDYTVYAWEGNVAINLNTDSSELTENSISLREALLQNKITMNEILAKAKQDFPDAVSYEDGGSVEYRYDNYTILKLHNLSGNKDVYIGPKDMTIYDLGDL